MRHPAAPREKPYMLRFILLAASLGPVSCLWLIRPGDSFSNTAKPEAPDYSNPASWAALPDRADAVDSTPAIAPFKDEQASAPADVFFIHPTLFFGRSWNADTADADVNARVDETTLKKQASVFNCCARIYAPRYRQATLAAFLDRENGAQALQLAYSDVLRAFDYYMANFNKGRPVIIASHSQGSWHAAILLKDRFDGKPLSRRLVAAYVIGMAVPEKAYTGIPPCADARQTGCVISYRAFTSGAEVRTLVHDPPGPYLCTNPLSWKNDTSASASTLNLGGVPSDFDRIDPGVCSAVCRDGILIISEPEAAGYTSVRGSYHVSDYSLFYMNLRQNVRERIQAFTSR